MSIAVNEERGRSGVQRLPEEARRKHRVTAQFRAGEIDELRRLAKAWGVPTSTVVWAIVIASLEKHGSEAARIGGPLRLEIVTGLRTLGVSGDLDRWLVDRQASGVDR